ncbi:MAG TPA: hypothetical protein VGJ14_12775 [Sporichthyaceae bacterium]
MAGMASARAACVRRSLPAGGGLALVTAITALFAHLGLRAAADGPRPGTPLLVGGTLLLTLVLWPLAARATRIRTLAAVFAAAQLGTHAVAVLADGWTPHEGARGLVCCPSARRTAGGLLGRLTADAGWGLLAVQMVACLALAIGVRGTRGALDAFTAALALLQSALSMVPAAWRLLVRAITAPLPAPAVAVALPPAPERGVRPSLLPVRRRPRRGPPLGVRSSPLPT